MCFHWKSLRRQIRILGQVEEVTSKEADDYYNSRPYKNKIGAWASSQSQVLDKRETFLEKIKKFEKQYSDQDSVPRPPNWSGWRLMPRQIEFWLDGEGRIQENLQPRRRGGADQPPVDPQGPVGCDLQDGQGKIQGSGQSY